MTNGTFFIIDTIFIAVVTMLIINGFYFVYKWKWEAMRKIDEKFMKIKTFDEIKKELEK